MNYPNFFKTKYSFLIWAVVFGLFLPRAGLADCAFHNIGGYIWSRNSGWISLSCSPGEPIDYGLDIDFESGNPNEDVQGYAWSANLGWLDFSPQPPRPNPTPRSARFEREPGGSPTTTAGRLTGYAKFTGLGEDGWILLGPLDFIDGTDYGVEIKADRTWTGWSYSSGTDEETGLGDGWQMWDSSLTGGRAGVMAYWFETLYGNIYSSGNIDSPTGLFATPAGRYTATYLIQADGAIHPVAITSQGGYNPPYRQENFAGNLQIPQSSNLYKGSLGPLDLAGLSGGRYGEVVEYSGNRNSSSTLGASPTLAGKVYHYSGNLTIDSAMTLQKGAGSQKGGGTILVDGDLRIDENIIYSSVPVNDRIDNLPSVAWIVLGDIIFDRTVTQADGVFYSEGTGGIATGTTGDSETDVNLLVNGLFIAKRINLQRIGINQSGDPAEKIIFDGRAIVNPPPGLIDIAKGLPKLREVSP